MWVTTTDLKTETHFILALKLFQTLLISSETVKNNTETSIKPGISMVQETYRMQINHLVKEKGLNIFLTFIIVFLAQVNIYNSKKKLLLKFYLFHQCGPKAFFLFRQQVCSRTQRKCLGALQIVLTISNGS